MHTFIMAALILLLIFYFLLPAKKSKSRTVWLCRVQVEFLKADTKRSSSCVLLVKPIKIIQQNDEMCGRLLHKITSIPYQGNSSRLAVKTGDTTLFDFGLHVGGGWFSSNATPIWRAVTNPERALPKTDKPKKANASESNKEIKQ